MPPAVSHAAANEMASRNAHLRIGGRVFEIITEAEQRALIVIGAPLRMSSISMPIMQAI